MRHLSPRGVATADSSLPLLWRAVGSGAGEPSHAITADPLPAVAVPWLLSAPVVGALAALALSFVVAVAGWVLYRREDPSGSEPPAPSAGPVPAERSPSVPDTATLSADEEFVVDLLQRHDGRLRQSAIVDASEWSKSKVSRLLSNMERKGYVEKVTIGRENAILLSSETE